MRINTGLSILQILINFQDIFARKYYFHIRGWRMKLTFGLLVFSYMLCAYFLQTGLHVYCFLSFSDTGHLFCSLFSLRVYSEASMLELFKDTWTIFSLKRRNSLHFWLYYIYKQLAAAPLCVNARVFAQNLSFFFNLWYNMNKNAWNIFNVNIC